MLQCTQMTHWTGAQHHRRVQGTLAPGATNDQKPAVVPHQVLQQYSEYKVQYQAPVKCQPIISSNGQSFIPSCHLFTNFCKGKVQY